MPACLAPAWVKQACSGPARRPLQPPHQVPRLPTPLPVHHQQLPLEACPIWPWQLLPLQLWLRLAARLAGAQAAVPAPAAAAAPAVAAVRVPGAPQSLPGPRLQTDAPPLPLPSGHPVGCCCCLEGPRRLLGKQHMPAWAVAGAPLPTLLLLLLMMMMTLLVVLLPRLLPLLLPPVLLLPMPVLSAGLP